jgi:hypothetical protein
MASDPQMELRVTRLENDTRSIYDLLIEFRTVQQEHSRQFEAIDQRFDQVDRRFDTIEMTLTEVVRRLPNPS